MHTTKTEAAVNTTSTLTYWPRPSKNTLCMLLLGIALNITGCSSTPNKHTTRHDAPIFGNPSKQTHSQAAISKHYTSWKGAPYKLGGLSKSGIDCSGFVHITFRKVFNKKIPRSTKLLAKSGKHINKKSLAFGDLVFFKTGQRVRHVGIYVDNGKFIHASTSRGVMTSSLNSPYWSQRYWKARRLN